MPCDTKLKPRQTISQRKEEIKRAREKFDRALVRGTAKMKVGPQGAVLFEGISNEDRDGVTDACAYRMLMVHGSAQAKSAMLRAEQMSGRSVNRQVIGQGAHSHDGGRTWHDHKG